MLSKNMFRFTMMVVIFSPIGIRRGDVVCIWSCNSYKWLQVQYACSMIGAIICTVNPGYQGPELLYAIQKAKAKAIFMPGAKSSQNCLNPFFEILSHPKVLNELKVRVLLIQIKTNKFCLNPIFGLLLIRPIVSYVM